MKKTEGSSDWICTVCGKRYKLDNDIKQHIEANQIFQDDLDDFLTSVGELHLKGLTYTNERAEEINQCDKKSLEIKSGSEAISQSRPPQQIQTKKEVQETPIKNYETVAIFNVNTELGGN